MKDFNEYLNEGGVLLGKSVQMGNRTGRIIKTVHSGSTSRYDDTYLVKFQDGTKVPAEGKNSVSWGHLPCKTPSPGQNS